MGYGIIEDTAEHFCLECGKPIGYGRTDKLYCSASCKNNRHNREMGRYRGVRSRVNTALAKNYNILDSLVASGVSSIRLADIQSMGFNIHCVTSFYSGKPRSMDFACYDILYSQSGLKIFNIHRVLQPAETKKPQG